MITDDDLSEVFAKVDWRVLGLLLGVNDEDLENIQQSHSSENQCQKAMIKCWTSMDWAYWSILVEALRGPVLGEDELAEDLESKHLGNERKEELNHYSLVSLLNI